MGVYDIALSGNRPCRLEDLADNAIHVDDGETYRIQELHLPV